jgi:hypothetical protein
VTSPDQIRSDKAAPSRFIRSDDQISDLIETLRAWLPDKEWKMPQQSWWLKVIQEHPDALREELERAKLYALSVVRTEREIPDADRGRYLTSKINKRCYPKPKPVESSPPVSPPSPSPKVSVRQPGQQPIPVEQPELIPLQERADLSRHFKELKDLVGGKDPSKERERVRASWGRSRWEKEE